jgi:23S rRNA (cytosine1962-C5)-methyltransferase
MNDKMIFLPDIIDGEDKSSQLINCLRNNYRHLRKWAKRTYTNCFRIYDRDIAQFPVAIDFYAGKFCVHYFSQGRDTDEPSPELKEKVTGALSKLFGATVPMIYWRTRAKSKETRQYEKVAAINEYFTVVEYGVNFRVNLIDYLDTGLFLDHRETRRLIASHSAGKRLLNLFAYTCSFSVQAAMAGAVFTKSVDMSNTYTAWGRKNFMLNDLSTWDHEIVRADCLKFINDEIRSGIKYDIIVVDPPTVSRSKKMDQLFDIQKDYISLLNKSMSLLNPHGAIFFSSNSRKFIFEKEAFSHCNIEELSHKTLPIDFRDKKIHRCWKISI